MVTLSWQSNFLKRKLFFAKILWGRCVGCLSLQCSARAIKLYIETMCGLFWSFWARKYFKNGWKPFKMTEIMILLVFSGRFMFPILSLCTYEKSKVGCVFIELHGQVAIVGCCDCPWGSSFGIWVCDCGWIFNQDICTQGRCRENCLKKLHPQLYPKLV